MDDNEYIKIITEVLKENSKEIYSDLMQPAIQNTGKILGTITSFFDSVVLYPIKKANLNYKYKLEDFSRQLAKKVIEIPSDKFVEPPLRIVGPVLEGMKYNYDNEDLREMFLNLLTSAMHKDFQENIHPSYVEIIKQLSPLDALVFKSLHSNFNHIACLRIQVTCENKFLKWLIPKYFTPFLYDTGDPFLVSKSLEFLKSLSLLNIEDGVLVNYNYDLITHHEFIESKIKYAQTNYPGKKLNIEQKSFVIEENDYGGDFAEICLKNINEK